MNKTILSLFLLAAVPAFVLAGPDARPDKEPGTKAVEGQRCDGRPRFGEVRKEHPDWKFCPTCGRPMNPQGFQKDKPKVKGEGDGEMRREKPRREGGDGEVRREKPRKDRGEEPMKKAPKKDAPVAAEDVAED